MSEKDQIRELGGALGWSVAARGVRVILGLVGSVLVVRGLGTHEYGILAVLRNVLAFVGILVGAGLGQGILRYFPVWRVAGGRTVGILAVFLGLQTLLWGVVLVAIGVLNGWIGELANPTVAGLLLLGGALLLPEVLGQTLTQVANASYDARGVSGVVTASTLAYVGLVAFFLERGDGIEGILWATALSNLILLLLLGWRIRWNSEKPSTSQRPETEERANLSTAIRYSLPFLLIGVLNLITWRQSEVLFLGHFRSANEAGFFDLAYRLPQMVLEFVPGAIWPLVMAGFSEVYTRDPGALQRTATAYYKLLFLLVAPLSVGGFLVGDLAVRILYGNDYALTGDVCQVLFLVFSVSFLATPLGMVLYVLERPTHALGIYLVTAAVNVGLDLILIPRFGVWGAVVPVSIVIVLSPFPYQWLLRRLGIRLVIPWGFLSRVYAASGLMLLLWPVRSLIDGLFGLLLLVAGGAVLFGVGLRMFRVIGPSERSLIERAKLPAWGWLHPVLASRGSKEGR